MARKDGVDKRSSGTLLASLRTLRAPFPFYKTAATSASDNTGTKPATKSTTKPAAKSATKQRHAHGSRRLAAPLRLQVCDLDLVRRTLTVDVTAASTTASLEAAIRSRDKKRPVAKDAVICLYALCQPGPDSSTSGPGPRRLQPGDRVHDICTDSTRLYYRIISADSVVDPESSHGEHMRFHFAWLPPSSHRQSKRHSQHDKHDKHNRHDRHDKRTPGADWLQDLARDIFHVGHQRDVQAVRTRLAAALHIDDPNRIALVAQDGLRPGQPLAGDAWQVRRLLTAWLCHGLVVQVHPPRRYLVVHGGGGVVRDGDGPPERPPRTYLFHPQPDSGDRSTSEGVPLSALQRWVRSQLLRGVHEHATSTLECASRHIQMLGGGSSSSSSAPAPLQRHTTVAWTRTVVFRLRDDVVEAFADDETWLLLPTATCMICLEDKAETELPHAVTAACRSHADATRRHVPTLCKPCLAEWIRSRLASSGWNRLCCPECPAPLAHADVRLFARPTVFARYDSLLTRAALAREFGHFQWCLAPGCASGQIHGGAADCPRFRCHACRAVSCLRHQMLWHTGETCDAYDQRTRRRQRDDKKSEAFVQQTSKTCPGCQQAVHKISGCNHISCICGHEWCYICFAPYAVSGYGILRCRHKSTCTESDLFDDLGLQDARRRQHLQGQGPRFFWGDMRPRRPRWQP